MASLLLICRHSPYGGIYAREALDMALAAAAFDVDVSLLFMDDGVYQLLDNQDTAESGNKNIQSVLNACPLYGIETFYADTQSLEARGLDANDLAFSIQACDTLPALSSRFDRVQVL